MTYYYNMHVVKAWGDHILYDKLTITQPVVEYIQKMYDFDLAESHKHCTAYMSTDDKTTCNEIDMKELHQRFYPIIKTDPTFLKFYEKMCFVIAQKLFPEEENMVIQRMPNIRFHMPGTVCVPPHRDMDEGENRTAHPEHERNFLLTLTQAFDTNSMYIESVPRKGDFEIIQMDANSLLHFHGNKCIHGNHINNTTKTRVSIDFRMIRPAHMLEYTQLGIQRSTRRNQNRGTIKLDINGYYKFIRLHAPILQMQPSFGREEADSAHKYIMSGGFLTEYRHTRQLEAELANFIGVKHCFMVSNGTLAISAALLAIGIKKDQRVLVPTYTMVATANAVKLIGAIPVFVDVDKRTNTLSPEIILEKINDVDAVIHVSLNNRCLDMHKIVEICKNNGKPLLEDAAQSLGSTWRGRSLGTFGDIGTFSFSSPKIISMGQGGCIVTDDDDIALRLRRIKDFGRDRPGVEEYSAFGVNLKYTDLQAVIGLEQMKKLPRRVQSMSKIWDTYYSHLGEYMIERTDDGWIPWFVEIFIPNRDEIAAKLRAVGIGVREVYPPIHLQTCYNQTDLILPNATEIRQHGLWLPSWSSLTTKQVENICICIKIHLNNK